MCQGCMLTTYLTDIQNILGEMLDYNKGKLALCCQKNINTLKYVDDITLMTRRKQDLWNLLFERKGEGAENNLLNVKKNKTKIMSTSNASQRQ